jgi:hypothetical protein
MQTAMETTLVGGAGGMLLTVANIRSEELVNTVLLAIIGTITSFVMAAALSWLTRRFRKNRNRE